MAAIAEYALLGDCHGAALVSRAGSVDWWCPSRFDAPSVFARLLDSHAGHWSIRPSGMSTVSRRYVEGTMVVQTEFSTATGVLRLTDGLALGAGERGHDVGYASPHVLVRRVEALRGQVDVELELVLRPEYGLVAPYVVATPGGMELCGGADRLLLTGDRQVSEGPDGTVMGRFRLDEGDSCGFALHHRRSVDEAGAVLDAGTAVDDTVAGWQSWSAEHQDYPGPYREQVLRSGLVLESLTYRPSGAVIAAATTSLPETIGATANWDYRFAWLRDGSFTLKALWVAACPHEARRFFDWMAASAGPVRDGRVPVMLGAAGEHDLTEHELGHLRGYADSRPVRIGNDAWMQQQLDVLGEVLECAWVLRDQLGDLAPGTAAFLRSVADRAAVGWHEVDAGIWEGREGQRHYVTSKVMCWVALDRAIRLADTLGASSEVGRWSAARDEVREAVLEQGWNESVNAFTGAFGSDHLDAGVLLMPLVGFLPGDDQRVLATLDAIESQLSRDGLVRRWTGAEDEGAFVICSYWLAAARASAGQVDRAREVFERVTSFANDVGLLSEEVDPRDGSLLGNFPQGLSHIGLVNAAWAIAEAEASGTTNQD